MTSLDIYESLCSVATCNINQWALDFDGNLERIMRSIREAKASGAKFRLGPELEISGYSCEDHFLEMDTYLHCDQSLAAILKSDVTVDILCDIGMPVLHNNVRYNCRIFCLNRKIVLIRPKVFMADDGNYRERRFFTSFKDTGVLEEHSLSDILRDAYDSIESDATDASTISDSTDKTNTKPNNNNNTNNNTNNNANNTNKNHKIVVPFGIATIATMETIIAAEICEELWTADSPHIALALAGVEIICNGSGSHHELRKLNSRLQLIESASSKCGGAYLYSNHRGCDGNRMYFDGCSLVCVNGKLVAQASQFSLKDVEVVTAIIDLNEIRSYRGASSSFQEQSSMAKKIPQIDLRTFSLRVSNEVSKDYQAPSIQVTNISNQGTKSSNQGRRSSRSPASLQSLAHTPNVPIVVRIHSPEEECAMGPACWMWDYLRRSGASGFLLPLSGGADSSSVAAIVRVMSGMVVKEIAEGNLEVIADARRILGGTLVVPAATPAGNVAVPVTAAAASALTSDSPAASSSSSVSSSSSSSTPSSSPSSSAGSSAELKVTSMQLCASILHTVYMGTGNSSVATRSRSQRLAEAIGSYHNAINIDAIVSSVLFVFTSLASVCTGTGEKTDVAHPVHAPRYESQGGTPAEDLALQNIQARLRMVMAYLCAQLLPWVRGRKGYLLVLGSANVDESLRGYMTKYDCSSADINPIGGICKEDLKRMMAWVARTYGLSVLEEIANAPPTAELRPIEEGETEDYSQTDEEDMGMSYKELGVFGYLRKVNRCGPVTMFVKLVRTWRHLTVSEVAVKVKRFFYFYSVNRHKMTVLTPSYHAESYSPDDNRFDLRQFLYNTKWTRQFNTIDGIIAAHEKK